MNRRQLLHAICIAMAGTSLPGIATAAVRQRVTVIGVGGAGTNLALALRATSALDGAEVVATYLCADTDDRVIQRVNVGNIGAAHLPAIQPLLLDGQRAVTGEVLPNRLRRMIAASDKLVLLAGLGGIAGSVLTPLIAEVARRQGVETVAAVVLPFGFEGQRVERASAALAELQSQSRRVIVSPNDTLAERYGSDLPLAQAFDRQERELAANVQQAIGLHSPSESV